MKKNILLTREQFSERVMARDKHKCVFCDRPATSAHHIIDRALFEDGGYYLENGASVCDEHHMQCEMTLISPAQVRAACGIQNIVLPGHLYQDQPYDKWANPMLPNGSRLRGEMFFEEGTQKMLLAGGVLADFLEQVRYPRTPHMTWSPGISSDDRIHKNMDFFIGKRVIISKKMDGESCSMYRDYIHARSLDSAHHPSRDWVKAFWAKFVRYQLPEMWRVCGENLYAVHSIAYEALLSYFMGFSLWNERNFCMDWDETLVWFELLNIVPVEVVYDGIYDEAVIRKLCEDVDVEVCEGLVMRTADGFSYADFSKCVAKYVRAGHVQTDEHWSEGPVVPNGLLK